MQVDVRPLCSVPGSGRSPEEGNGNPLQFSCLENPMHRGAWQAAAHRVTQSWTRLYIYIYIYIWASVVVQMVKNLPAMQETQV